MLGTRRLTDWIVYREEYASRVAGDMSGNKQPDPAHRSGGVTRRSCKESLQGEIRMRKTRQPSRLDLWLP